jgi:cystathionine beta-lyase
MQTFLADEVPAVNLIQPEGTYLAWLDFRELGLDAKQLDKFLAQEAGLALNSGYWFGREGAGFARMTIGAPRMLLEQAMTQLRDAIRTL